MKNYQSFIESKKVKQSDCGFVAKDLNKNLFDYQKRIVEWACKKGKSAIFADCGMGKTLMQLEFASQVHRETGKSVLILAPLAVATQTIEEGKHFGIEVKRLSEKNGEGVFITNYEQLHNVNACDFVGVVLDESSILKAFTGKIRNQIIEDFSRTPYKLACTATPSPNDFDELGNHSEFLNSMSRVEMLSMFFINDCIDGDGWRLKGHAVDEFWRWVGSWAVMLQKPSNIGYSDDGFILPELKIHTIILKDESEKETLFSVPAQGLTEVRESRKESLAERVRKTAELVNASDEQWLVWCDFNEEGDELEKAIQGSVQVSGSDTPEHKEKTMMDFSHGKLKCLVSKSKIAGWGMNWQNCHNMAFCGISYSYESYYQSVRRCYRFGQKKDVNVHIVLSEREVSVLESIQEKEKMHKDMNEQVVNSVKEYFLDSVQASTYKEDIKDGNGWTAMMGDCIERIKEIPENSIDFSVFSPPFADLYTYSNSERDMGNCKNKDEFYFHFDFLAKELMRVVKDGRLVSFHCMNMPTSKYKDGYIGLYDFRGDMIRIFQNAGFIYHSEVCIWKDPVVAMQRTKALGLLHKTIKKDSSMSRQGIADYLVTMRKPGENKEPISHTADEFPVDEWQKIASPVWTDINQSNTLQKKSARDEKDEKHICPLQLDVIERALYLWSNPNDLVLSPFMGIGSEGYASLKCGRRFVGIELKESYYKQACANLESAESIKKQLTLFKS